jgi:hypothetical protein
VSRPSLSCDVMGHSFVAYQLCRTTPQSHQSFKQNLTLENGTKRLSRIAGKQPDKWRLESFKSFYQIHRLVDGPANPVSSPIVFFALGQIQLESISSMQSLQSGVVNTPLPPTQNCAFSQHNALIYFYTGHPDVLCTQIIKVPSNTTTFFIQEWLRVQV